MPQARVFLPQAAIEDWLNSGAAQMSGDSLSLDGTRFLLTPAVRVLREVAGGEDHGLLGRVKTLTQLSSLGGELCAGSVVLDDSAFEVVEGFLAEPASEEASEGEAQASTGPTHDEIVKLLSRR
jgi:hypothetical protein